MVTRDADQDKWILRKMIKAYHGAIFLDVETKEKHPWMGFGAANEKVMKGNKLARLFLVELG